MDTAEMMIVLMMTTEKHYEIPLHGSCTPTSRVLGFIDEHFRETRKRIIKANYSIADKKNCDQFF